ncbi:MULTISPECIES: FeoA family protein [Streptococcus]
MLLDGKLHISYRIIGIDLPEESQRHLSNLGLTVGRSLRLVSKTRDSAILMLKASRLAFDSSILQQIEVEEEAGMIEAIPLSELETGQTAYVAGIFAMQEAKRRLMDMGITRNTKILLRKVAPLGDPIEISLRGYELTLRKSEAQLISVIPMKREETP